MRRLYLLLFAFVPLSLWAGDDTENTGGIWTEVEMEKVMAYNLSIGAGLGYRTTEWFDESSRWDASLGLGWKVNKYLKLNLGYAFIMKHYQEKMKEHYDENEDGELELDGYNIDAANWAKRHRVFFDVSADKRFWNILKIALRERYQYTHQPSREVDRIKLRDPVTVYNGDESYVVYEDTSYVVDQKKAKDRHVLRSRLTFSIDKKDWQWEPYVAVEFFNDLRESMHLDKIRSTLGVKYSFTPQHKLGVGYMFNHENDDDGNQNIHAISIGYTYKF